MAATIVATVGASNANSYVTLAEAITYFDERLNIAAWTGATTDERNRALIMATRRIDQEDFLGVPAKPLVGAETTETTQALKWPRVSAPDAEGRAYDDGVIPSIVKHATFEMALALLAEEGDLLADTGLEGFEQLSVGSLDMTPRNTRRAGALPANVRRLLLPVLGAADGSIRLERC